MHLKIEKSGDRIAVSYTPDPSKKPITLIVTRTQLFALLPVLQAAANADVFSMEVKL